MSEVKKTRVLICEDEEDLREILESYLEDEVDEIVAVENGLLGLDLAKREKFDAIVSDINMPSMSGLEFLENLREAEVETPFILCTAFSDKDNAITALRLGAFDFIEKPVDESRLQGAVRNAVEMSKEQDLMAEELEKSVEDFRRKQKAIMAMKLSLKFKKKAS